MGCRATCHRLYFDILGQRLEQRGSPGDLVADKNRVFPVVLYGEYGARYRADDRC